MRPDFQSASFSHTLVPCSFRNKDQNRLKMFSWNVLFLFLLHNSVLSGCSSFYVCCLSFWWMNCWFWLFCKLALYLNFMYKWFWLFTKSFIATICRHFLHQDNESKQLLHLAPKNRQFFFCFNLSIPPTLKPLPLAPGIALQFHNKLRSCMRFSVHMCAWR